MVTSPYEWKTLEWDDKPKQTNKQTNKQTSIFKTGAEEALRCWATSTIRSLMKKNLLKVKKN